MNSAFSRQLCIFTILGLLLAGAAAAGGWPGQNTDNPVEPDEIAAFMANGVFDPADPSYLPPTADDFDEVIMGRDEVEKAARRAEAVLYFIERFGIDFSSSDEAQDGNIALLRAYQDPRWNYRAYKLPGVNYVPSHGLIVHDAQYIMAVVGPEATLYGSWGGAGTVVPGGTVAVDGEYLIQGTDKFKLGHPKNIYIQFQSASPIFDAFSGRITFDCRLDSAQFGEGIALGRQELYPLADGTAQVSVVNILQFPAPQWSVEQDAGFAAD